MKKLITVEEDMLFFAFRYALGRMTYVTGWVSDVIIAQWDNLSTKNRDMIKKEIREALDEDKAGMSCDRSAWERILKLP